MMQIHAKIITVHEDAACVASAIAPDNLRGMMTVAKENRVTTVIDGTRIRSVIASVDDYLMNLAIAEDTCSFGRKQEQNGSRMVRKKFSR
jgi:threonine aldolase